MRLSWFFALAHGLAAAVILLLVEVYLGTQAHSRPTEPLFFFLVVGMAAVLGGLASRLLRRPIDDLTDRLRTGAAEAPRPWPDLPSSASRELGDLCRALQDLRERSHETVQSLTLALSRQREILDSMSDAVLVTDGHGRITLTNQALDELFGITDTVPGRRPADVIRNVLIGEAVEEVLANHRQVTCEVPLPGARTRHLDVQVAPILEDDRLMGTVTVLHEITRLRRLERIRADFVANVSHELRTPLTAIRGCAETLADGAIEDPEVAGRFATVIRSHAERLTILLNDLLDLSRLESEELQIDLQPHGLNRIVEAATTAVEESRAIKAIEIHLKLGDPSLQVRCDRQLIEQALINLIDNAIKYTPGGGQVTIRVRSASPQRVPVELATHDLSLTGVEGDGKVVTVAATAFIEVADSGIGIPANEIDRVFERFYRVDKGRSRQLGGTGLGLAIVRHTIALHGGRVFADSELGRGSTFGFTLPIV